MLSVFLQHLLHIYIAASVEEDQTSTLHGGASISLFVEQALHVCGASTFMVGRALGGCQMVNTRIEKYLLQMRIILR